MANTWKRAHGATVKFDAEDAIEDCTIIGIPGDMYDLIEKPSLEDTRKSFDLSDTPDSDEVSFTMPYKASWSSRVTGTTTDIEIYLAKPDKTLSFTAIVTADQPGPAEVGGLLSCVVTVKPTTIVSVT